MKYPTRFQMIKEICKKLDIKIESTKLPKFDSCGEVLEDGRWYQIQNWWALKSTIKKVYKRTCKSGRENG